ncbi:MAG TPA: ribosome biogenesis GTPase Der [Actinomycetota bacterium]
MSAGRPVVAVVGRTNVGKSTLVNRLLGRREAIEHDMPGVTRDRQGYPVEWGRRSFLLVDTGGWEPRARGLAAKVVEQAERAAAQADLILFVVDASTGAIGDDVVVARTLRRSDVPVIVVANKVDTAALEDELHALQRLGLGHALPVSALHGRGSGDVLDAIVATLPDDVPVRDHPDRPLRVAVVGRPNAGKSSLFNRLTGQNRSIVDATPGTTRDTVDETVTIGDKTYEFIDTAGMRRRAKQAEGPEYYGLVRSLRAIDRADVAIIVIDAEAGITDQDQRIADRVIESGRAAILVLNKWDLLDEDAGDQIERDIERQFPFLRWAPLVRTSALTKRGIGRVMPAVEAARASWEKRIPTAALNGWIRAAVEKIPLGSRGTRPPRIKYVTQASVRPPTVIVFASDRLPDHATKALENSLRATFGFDGSPIRVAVRVRKRERNA